MTNVWLCPDGVVAPGPNSTDWLGFRYARLEPGTHRLSDAGPGHEAGVVLIEGEVDVARAGRRFHLGPRPNPFEYPPELAFFPAGEAITVESAGDAVVAVAWAAGDPALEAYRLGGSDITSDTRGVGATERTIRHLLEADRPANRLYLVEVVTPGAHWSSFPPHRHDVHKPPAEYAMEEAYVFRVDPPQHRGLMGTWSANDDTEAAFVARDGDLMMVKAGYHTVSAAPGSRLYYLNAMAGPERVWKPLFHPRYLHLVEGWGPVAPDAK